MFCIDITVLPHPLKNLDHVLPWHTYFCLLLGIKAMFFAAGLLIASAYCAFLITVGSPWTLALCTFSPILSVSAGAVFTAKMTWPGHPCALQPRPELGPLNTGEYSTACCLLAWEPRGFRATLGPIHHYATLVATKHLGEICFKQQNTKETFCSTWITAY